MNRQERGSLGPNSYRREDSHRAGECRFTCLNGERPFFLALNRAFLMSVSDNDTGAAVLYSRAILELLYGTHKAAG